MQTMRDKWTDERLDDLNAKVDRGFEELRAEMRAMRAEMNARFEEINGRLDAQAARIDTLTRTMLWFAGTLIVAMVACVLAASLAS